MRTLVTEGIPPRKMNDHTNAPKDTARLKSCVGNADPGVPAEPAWNFRITLGEYGKWFGFAENLLQFPELSRRNAGVGVPYGVRGCVLFICII